MQLGAHYAGVAIENSMLGATHACANPLTAHYGTTHGLAIATLLAPVVRWNGAAIAHRYAELANLDGHGPVAPGPAERLALRLEELAAAAELPRRLRDIGVAEKDLLMLAREAASQWTGRFNPRAFDEAGALEIYRQAF
jgi:alcohol dehydrogenase